MHAHPLRVPTLCPRVRVLPPFRHFQHQSGQKIDFPRPAVPDDPAKVLVRSAEIKPVALPIETGTERPKRRNLVDAAVARVYAGAEQPNSQAGS